MSDIHIETQPGRDKLRIRFRKDGVLRPYMELPHTYRNALVARLKIMCDLDISERRKPQDGKISFARFVPGQRLELRVATIPTVDGPRGRGPAPARLGARRSRSRSWACERNLARSATGDRATLRHGAVRAAPPARARRPRCTARSATSTHPSARSGPPRTRSRSRSRGCGRCR